MIPMQGKYGVLEMSFEVDSRGKTILRHLYRRVPMIVQQALYFDEQLPSLACVYILSSGGPNLDGDRYLVDVELGAGAMAHISTGAATVISPMESDSSRLHQRISLEDGAYLEWLPKPIIPCAHSRYTATTEAVVAPSAVLFFSEVVACGRLHSGERFDYDELSLSTVICRPSSEVVAREALTLIPRLHSPEEWAILGCFSHFGSVLVVAPEEITRTIYQEMTPIVESDFRMSISLLRDGCGLSIRLVGQNSERLLGEIRTLCSIVRKRAKGVPLQEEFPWR